VTFVQLRILQAVARTGNMTRAAEELRMTQPAVSHALRGLERELGVTLLIRRSDGVTPTAVGRAVTERAARILTQLEGLQQEAAAARGRAVGRLLLGVFPSVNARLFPRILAAFSAAHPEVTLRVLEGSDAEVLDWLLTGAVDIATVTSVSPEIVTTTLTSDRMLAVVPAAHRLSERSAVRVADLAREPFIMSTGGCEPLITAVARQAGVRLRSHYRVRDAYSILAMVAEGLGVTIMPELALPVGATGIHALPLEPEESRTVLLGLPADCPPLPAAAAFAELARREAGATSHPASPTVS